MDQAEAEKYAKKHIGKSGAARVVEVGGVTECQIGYREVYGRKGRQSVYFEVKGRGPTFRDAALDYCARCEREVRRRRVAYALAHAGDRFGGAL